MRWIFAVAVTFLPALGLAADLFVESQSKGRLYFSTESLLMRKDVRSIAVQSDPGYQGAPKRYLNAIPAAAFFSELAIPADATLKFVCLDNYSATINLKRILEGTPEGAQAYIAIETSEEAWGPVKKDSPSTAGPFYLIWENSQEVVIPEWPYQLAGFEVISTR